MSDIPVNVVLQGDCLELLKELADNSVDSMVTDPPAGISFMNKGWDDPDTLHTTEEKKSARDKFIAWLTLVMVECLRVLKPGGHALVWSLPRTSHWTATAIEDAGFEIRDVISHIFGSGMPKSLNISKAIDKAAGATREVIRPGQGAGKPIKQMTEEERQARIGPSVMTSNVGVNTPEFNARIGEITAPATEDAKKWDGWGTNLKPAYEGWILARKPIEESSIIAQVVKTGTGAINIDGSRIRSVEDLGRGVVVRRTSVVGDDRQGAAQGMYAEGSSFETFNNPAGRWPANIIFSHGPDCQRVGTEMIDAPVINRFDDGAKPFGGGAGHAYTSTGGGQEERAVYACSSDCPLRILDEQSGSTQSAVRVGGEGEVLDPDQKGWRFKRAEGGFQDKGGASRFFSNFEPDYDVSFLYTGKASKRDKNADLDEVGLMNIHPCLHPDALVMTEAGYRLIQTIQIGDKVLSADGRFHEVEQVSQHRYTSESLVEIRVAGTNLTTLASDNHPFLIWRPTRKGAAIVGHEIKWLQADQIEVGDYTMAPLVNEPLSDAPHPEDTDFWFLIGLYLAEGCPHNGGYASFSLHEDEVDLVQRVRMYSEPSKIGVYPKKGPEGEATKGIQVVSFNRELGAACLKLCGKGAKGKSIDPCIWGLNEESQRAFLEGYLAGDGGTVRTYIQAKTVSPDIASQIRFLAEKLGYKVELQLYPAEEGGIGERRFKNTSPVYVLRFNSRNCSMDGRKPSRPTWCEHEGATFTLSYVKSVNRVPYQGDVVNLSVEGSPTFQTAVGMSHNTVKSQQLMTFLVKLVTPPGGLVLDPFAGSGSTLVAAVNEGFRFIGMERDPEYFRIASHRALAATKRAETDAGQREAFDMMGELPED